MSTGSPKDPALRLRRPQDNGITKDQFSSLMAACGPFEPHPRLAVAVSGGADSLALLLLADEWAKAHHGKIFALTVDHGLRQESAAEARQVHGWCKAHKIEQHILLPLSLRERGGVRAVPQTRQAQSDASPSPGAARHPLPKGEGNITQSLARDLRYRLLTDWCEAHRIAHLLLAHHQNDQAETLLFRLARGSGLSGLACMPPVAERGGIRLLRPLLPVPKARLVATLQALGQPWIEDPSNRHPRYTRSHIRAYLERQPPALAEQACQLTRRLQRIRSHMEKQLAGHMAQAVSVFPEGHAVIRCAAFKEMPPEYGLKALSALVTRLNGAPYPPRTEKLRRLYGDLQKPFRRRTFARLLFTHRQGEILVCREPVKGLKKRQATPI